MFKKSIYVIAYSLLSFLAMSLSHAEEKIDQRELRNVITGNTVEGKILKPASSYKMYFHPSGKLVQIASKDSIKKGSWRINKQGNLCIKLGVENCRTIKKRGEAEFNLYNQQGSLELTIDKVILGNPDKM